LDDALRARLVGRGFEVAARSGWESRVDTFLELC